MGFVGTLALSPTSIAFKGKDQTCNWIESGNFELTANFRLFKNETLLCVFADGELIVETNNHEPVCGSAVRYVNFGQEDISYRRHKKGKLTGVVQFHMLPIVTLLRN